MALTLADVWQLATAGRAIVLAQGSIDRAATPLAGHGACQLNGAPVVLASYDQQTGNWTTNPNCFRLPAYLKDRNASALWQADSEWMSHSIDSAAAVRYSALFPAFEADAMTAMIEREPVGADNVTDLILLNYKGADFVGHKYGPDSSELRVTLGAMDRHLARMFRALEAKVGNNYLLAVTADHGMPSEPSSPDRRHFAQSIVDLLHDKFDPEAKQLITSFEPENSQMFVDEDRLSALGLTLRDLAHFLESQPFLFAAFTHDDVRLAANAVEQTPQVVFDAAPAIGRMITRQQDADGRPLPRPKHERAAVEALGPTLVAVPRPLQPPIHRHDLRHAQPLGVDDPLRPWPHLFRIDLRHPHAERAVRPAEPFERRIGQQMRRDDVRHRGRRRCMW
jgi:hypothetical protein